MKMNEIENELLKINSESQEELIKSQKVEIEQWENAGTFDLTAYCPCKECSGKWGNKTKSGSRAKENKTVAVDPNVIEIGSKVKINGKVYVAEDIGAAVKGNTIDIYFDSHEDVEEFGRQKESVEVKE